MIAALLTSAAITIAVPVLLLGMGAFDPGQHYLGMDD